MNWDILSWLDWSSRFVRKCNFLDYPNGTEFQDSENCTTFDADSYGQLLISNLNYSEFTEEDDVAFTQEYIEDVLDFAQEDLYCP